MAVEDATHSSEPTSRTVGSCSAAAGFVEDVYHEALGSPRPEQDWRTPSEDFTMGPPHPWRALPHARTLCKILLGVAATRSDRDPARRRRARRPPPPPARSTPPPTRPGRRTTTSSPPDYTCGVNADGKTVVDFNIIFDGGTGSGVLVPDSANGGTFAFDGVTAGSDHWHYAGTYAPPGTWTKASATAAGGTEVYNFGTAGQTAQIRDIPVAAPDVSR